MSREPGFKAQKLSMLFPVRDGAKGMEKALDKLFALADEAIEQDVNIFILSDRGVDSEMGAHPGAAGDRRSAPSPDPPKTRTRCAIVVESGEPREVHHFCAADRLWRDRDQSLYGL